MSLVTGSFVTSLAACGGDDGAGMGDAGTTEAPATSAAASTSGDGGGDDDAPAGSTDEGGADSTSGGPAGSDGADVSSGTGGGGGDDDDGDGSGSDTGNGVVYDEEFVWVADFLRTNCVACHATNVNGNLLLPSPDISNEEVRAALEGVVATTGLLLFEPGDREASQTWLQITNEFGAQFPVEDTDRFGAWIDAGASYFAQ